MSKNRKKAMISLERKAKDALIECVIKDPKVKILADGTVWARRHREASQHRLRDAEGFVESTISNGNRRVFFYNRSMLSVPRLVYRAHVGPLDPEKEIIHKDGNSANNAATNLELLPESMGAGYALRRFSADQVLDMRERRHNGERLDTIAEEYDTSAIVVSKICRGETYQEIDGPRTSSDDLGTPQGPDNPKTKLNHQDYGQLLMLRSQGKTLKELAAQFKLSKSGVSKICKKEVARGHLTYPTPG